MNTRVDNFKKITTAKEVPCNNYLSSNLIGPYRVSVWHEPKKFNSVCQAVSLQRCVQAGHNTKGREAHQWCVMHGLDVA